MGEETNPGERNRTGGQQFVRRFFAKAMADPERNSAVVLKTMFVTACLVVVGAARKPVRSCLGCSVSGRLVEGINTTLNKHLDDGQYPS